MADVSSSAVAAPDPAQKRRLTLGVVVFIAGWVIGLALIPLVNRSGMTDALKATLSGVLLLVVPKVFLLIAVAIMGKPGFAYLKSLVGAYFRRFAPPATVSAARYRIGLILLITPIVLSSLGDYLSLYLIPLRQEYPYLIAMAGDLLILAGLFVLGGDFWDKLRSLFVHEAKAVFPSK
ncbi:hypothetical protein [Povalibacter sp.]|uniref:hypothetical protein n=1 Tax=Povalibacter sp. TaxID=1962978 RepID=UPI002F42436E